MISFIVIGKNEGSNLNKCFSSIKRACIQSAISDYEIIYVDSRSTDDSLDIALKSDISKIIILETLYSRPIARNIGATQSKGDILAFLDGDMELYQNFLSSIITEESRLHYPLVSGRVHQLYYNSHNHIDSEKIENDQINHIFSKPITGGAFLINRDIFISVNGFDNRFMISEDPELGLRLAKRGILLTHLPILFVKHNTELIANYNFYSLLKGNQFYANLMIYKNNLTGKYTYLRMWSHDRTLIILIVCSLLSAFLSTSWMFFYLLALALRSNLFFSKNCLQKFLYLLIRDISVLVAFPFYFKRPLETKDIPFKVIQLK